MKKKVLIGSSILLFVLLAAGMYIWYAMSRALYEPGALASTAALQPPPQTAGEPFWEVERGVKLHYFSDGSGAPVLVVHGGPGYPIGSPPAGLKLLAARHKFFYYDQRGCGKSSRPVDRFTSPNYYANVKALDRALGLAAQVGDIERIRRILGEERLALLGHSFGGFLAALYAAEFPERVKGLILVAPADLLVMPQDNGGLIEQVRRLLPEKARPQYAAFLQRYFDYGRIFTKSEADLARLNAEFANFYRQAAGAGNAPPPEFEARESGGWMVHAMYFSMGRRHDYRAALKRVTAPVLVVHGENDLQDEKTSRRYAEAFPNARFVVIRKAGHFVFSDQPQEFAAAAGKFLGEL